MESLTKNRQSKEAIQTMVKKIFPLDELDSYTELTEGYFNVAYEVVLKNGKSAILKVAPPENVPVMSYEKNIMFSEVEAMKMIAGNPEIPVAKIYGYDDSCTICPSSYFFMEKLEGASLYSLRDKISEEEKLDILKQTGQINRKVNEITCPCFGFPGQPQLQGKEWYPVFKEMLKLSVRDAEARNIDQKIPTEKLWEYLERDREIFEEVQEPKLVHWDCWDGNIFVKDGKVTGLIDWERCLWADPLLEVGFRTYKEDRAFMEGYGFEKLTKSQHRRALWYDIYLLLLVSLECEYRKYETMDMYEWSTGLLVKQFEKLK